MVQADNDIVAAVVVAAEFSSATPTVLSVQEKEEFSRVITIFNQLNNSRLGYHLATGKEKGEAEIVAKKDLEQVKLSRKKPVHLIEHSQYLDYSYRIITLKDKGLSLVRYNHGNLTNEKKNFEGVHVGNAVGSYKDVKTGLALSLNSEGVFDVEDPNTLTDVAIARIFPEVTKDEYDNEKNKLDNHGDLLAAIEPAEENSPESDRAKRTLVMPLVKGKNLYDMKNEDEPLTYYESLVIAKACLEELMQSHYPSSVADSGQRTAGSVHMDIKPDNIMFDRQSGQVKIIDWGYELQVGEPLLEPKGTMGYSATEVAIVQFRELYQEFQDGSSDKAEVGESIYSAIEDYIIPEQREWFWNQIHETNSLLYSEDPIIVVPGMDMNSLGVVFKELGLSSSLYSDMLKSITEIRPTAEDILVKVDEQLSLLSVKENILSRLHRIASDDAASLTTPQKEALQELINTIDEADFDSTTAMQSFLNATMSANPQYKEVIMKQFAPPQQQTTDRVPSDNSIMARLRRESELELSWARPSLKKD